MTPEQRGVTFHMRMLMARTLLPLLATFSCAGLQAAETGALASGSLDVADTGKVRVIVKFRGSHRQADVADTTAGDEVKALAGRTGISLTHFRSIQPGLRVMEVGALAAPGSLGVALQRLREDPGVQYAEVDQRRHAHAVLPDDTLFDGPYSGQWYLKNAVDTPSAIDAVTAWDTTRGSTGVIIAVLDTGVRYEHPDLLTAGAGGRLLPGYDFVSSTTTSNDGDGRDPDPSDPGDWASTADSCKASGSSWHGTRVSGIIAALSNNAMGVAGILWTGWVLPVRVLGKCGGADSDIAAAMLWAGGIPVAGAPPNPYPARVINLSLGGTGACPAEYADAVNQLSQRGVLVVASAGNESSLVDAPADCPGVAGIAAIRHIGTKVGFSNLGPAIALSAPGGNCVNVDPGTPCLYSIDTTTNLGTTDPAANGYTDRFTNVNVGTSFSAPIVAGIAGLMAAVNGNLTPAQLTARLRGGAMPFPTDPALPTCHVPVDANDTQLECVCTTDTCGAGMANARGAVEAALRPIAAITLPGRFSPGQDVVLRGSGSGAACGHALASYAWSVVSGTPPSAILGANTDTATVKAPSSGSYTVRLTVMDDAGRQDTADVVVQPTSATTAAPASAGAAACPAPIVAITLTPVLATVQARGGTIAFSASVANATDTGILWYVNDAAGGNATVGTISTSGLYTAPASAPAGGGVTIKAVPAADPSRFAAARVTITAAPASGGSGSGGGGGGGGGGGTLDPVALLALLAARVAHLRCRPPPRACDAAR